ncbi:putative Zn-dependent protease DUF2268 [Flavobacterium sp. 90]|uniref:gliding motility protein GldB-related protein n=1 Tax=unclassified Flavobacterium TaxID=196869 RepID=UPI000EB54F47|nr:MULTISPECIES: DUF2268 domain-containing putative Zn-dependent protease [unclassified Flavobacterium]RKR05350.1 putative Zn-dependent protease DUF2268 [Flavobacterium sp. 81]TCK56665.1 putative Zn-dependent protease DUF2268 [Flavobacterium sp. 90]
MKLNLFFTTFFIVFSNVILGQSNFSENPLDAVFETKDSKNFWQAFDKMDKSKENPFVEYIQKGSPGVKAFTENRIINADSLFAVVKKRKSDYELSRNVLDGLSVKKKRVIAIYSALKYWYPNAKFPPIYFVYGRFNSGGTSAPEGIIIGIEKLQNLDGVSGLIAHELIHYQQKIKGKDVLLKWCLLEGGADFMGELTSGEAINQASYKYGEQNRDKLCEEFVTRLKNPDYQDWLYGTSNKDDRPNDLGYWIGYKIIESYFNKQKDKQKAIQEIMNINDPMQFLKESGFLDVYIQKYQKSKKESFDDFFK